MSCQKLSHLVKCCKKPSVCSRGRIFCSVHVLMEFGQNVFYDYLLDKFENGSKTRSAGQTLEKQCVSHKGHIFSPVLLKESQNVCLGDISDGFENGSNWLKT